MFEIKKPKIGLAGVMSTPFRGDKESNFEKDRQGLESLSQQLGFELLVVKQGIYDLKQAEAAARQLEEWGADFILLQTSSFASGDFLYPFTRLDARLGLWAVPEGPPSPEGGLPLNSFTAANMYNSIIRFHLKDYQKPVKWFLGRVGSFEFKERLTVTVAALRVLANLPGSKVALIGGVAPSFDNLIVDSQVFSDRLGVEIIPFELEQVLEGANQVSDDRVQETTREIKVSAAVYDPRQMKALEKSARVYQSVLNLAKEQALDGVAMSCWPQFQTDYGLAVCTVMGHLNGHGAIAACEGDATSAVSMLMLRWMSGGDVVTLMDLVSIDPADQSVLLWHCGPTSPTMADERGARLQPLWLFDGPGGERTGLHNDLVLKPGPGTVLGLTPDLEQMLILEGGIDSHKPSYMGSRGWLKNLCLNDEPITTAELVQTLMATGFQHHYPFAYGSLAAPALELCTWLGIDPIQKQPYTSYLKGYHAR